MCAAGRLRARSLSLSCLFRLPLSQFRTTFYLMRAFGPVPAFLFFASVNAGLVLAACALTTLAPAARGSGIGETKAYLNGVAVPGMLSAATLAVKAAGSAGAVAGGLAVGKEGPFVHIGAAIGALVGQGGVSPAASLRWRCFEALRTDAHRRDFVTCGASVGVAAAFRSPVGGLLFAQEEVATHWSPELTWRCFAANALCVATLRAGTRFCAGGARGGRCGFFDATSASFLFDISPETGGQDAVALWELLPMAALAVFGGLAGAAFGAASTLLVTWRRDVVAPRGPAAQLCEAAALSLLTSALCFCVPLAFACSPCPRHLGDCPRGDDHPGVNFVAWGCAQPGQYNDLATLMMVTPEAAIRNLFSSQTPGEYTGGSLAVFGSLFSVLALATYGACVPSGLFVPSALVGATVGRAVGAAMVARFPGTPGLQEGTYALLGAAAVLGGATRMTVSLCVILLELTANLTLLPVIMAVLLIAKWSGDVVGPSIYDAHVAVKRLPLLHLEPPPSLRRLTALQLVAHQGGRPDCVALRGRAGDAAALLAATQHGAYPVLDARGALAGAVPRAVLHALLSARAGLTACPEEDVGGEAAEALRLAPKVVAATASWAVSPPAAPPPALTPAEAELFLPLRPWMNAAPQCVQPAARLPAVHALFRALGLRHLLVINGETLLGVLTRKDLLPGAIIERQRAWRGAPHPLTLIERDQGTMPAFSPGRGAAARPAPAAAGASSV